MINAVFLCRKKSENLINHDRRILNNIGQSRFQEDNTINHWDFHVLRKRVQKIETQLIKNSLPFRGRNNTQKILQQSKYYDV